MRVQRCGLAQALVLTAYAAEVVTAFLHSLPNKDAMQLPICRGVPFRIMWRQHRTRDAVQNNTGLYTSVEIGAWTELRRGLLYGCIY
jgi:hypothetical protein